MVRFNNQGKVKWMFNSKVARMQVLTVTAVLILVAVATGCGPQPIEATPTSSPEKPTKTPAVPVVTSQPPTLIFYNGTVLTMNTDQPEGEAIAVADEMILAVGTNDDILALQAPDTRVVDLQGLTLMPGFVDTHTHILTEGVNNPAVGTLEKAQALALQNGITTLGNLYTSPEFVQEMRALDGAGKLRVRTSLYLTYANACGEVLGNWYQQYPPTHQPGEMLRIAGVKVYADGGSCGYPATSFDRQVGGQGNLWFTQEELNRIVSDIDTTGYQVAIHAIGDRAVTQALNAIEFALDGRPNTLRHRIEHNSTVSPDSYPRYQKIGVIPSIIGNVWSCNEVFFIKGIVPDPPEYQAWNFPYRAMLDASPEAHFAWHTDYPWSSPNPLFHLYSLVTPYEIAGDLSECPDPSWVGNKTLTVDEALPMMTIEGAYAMFRDEEVGSLEPGKYADLIILSGNPSTDLEAIRNIKVWMTMVAGQVEWCAPGHGELCPGSVVSEESPQISPVRIRIQITTTSDWATLTLKSGGILVNPQVVSSSTEVTNMGVSDNRFFINQTIEHANSGASVDMVVDVTLSDAQTAGQLEFVIESGAIGDTTVRLFNYLQDSPIEASVIVLNETSKTFSLPVAKFSSP
jgi:predicted amidohydrolase YtcJ